MDIIAAHQQGLIEQLEEEVAALAGRPRDHVQRAIVLHHLYDHSGGAHVWALSEARRELRIVKGIAALERRLDRWGWFASSREEARAALACLAAALGERSRRRTAGAYFAYRVSATAALRNEAEQRLPGALLEALDHCHLARRGRARVDMDVAASLEGASEANSEGDCEKLRAAWSAIDGTKLKRLAHRLLDGKALALAEAKDRKRGWSYVERALRGDDLMPAAFRANPAQHFYALQLSLAERRRQQWREACDREPDAFELAA